MNPKDLSQPQAHCYWTSKVNDLELALAQTTHLGIGAHQDDLEVMAAQGIMNCYQQENLWFSGVTCTNGEGSARAGDYSDMDNEEMVKTRRQEQVDSAERGDYSAMIQLAYPSSEIKKNLNQSL
ncbi:MAG: PIG-L family deacetylase, partial [Bdellovibrionales bacterium]|nr:PIG-L family deacetylase [Bdellovibrionales bacterium]